jgi:hypothetical protein
LQGNLSISDSRLGAVTVIGAFPLAIDLRLGSVLLSRLGEAICVVSVVRRLSIDWRLRSVRRFALSRCGDWQSRLGAAICVVSVRQ